MITIINYGMGNLASIRNMLKKLGHKSVISAEKTDIEKASKLILPGVGSFDTGMNHIAKLGLRKVLDRRVLDEDIPVLGICLGMQLLTRGSEEGKASGLGWLDAETVRFRFDGQNAGLKVPHMGWNRVRHAREDELFMDMYEKPRFYFVHSFYVKCDRAEDVICTTHYGFDFCSGVRRDNIMAVQFHPEKSHKFGMKLLQNFAELV